MGNQAMYWQIIVIVGFNQLLKAFITKSLTIAVTSLIFAVGIGILQKAVLLLVFLFGIACLFVSFVFAANSSSDTAVRISCSLAAAMFGRFVIVPFAKTVMAMRTLRTALPEVLKERMEAMEKSEKEAAANESLAIALSVEKEDAAAKLQDAFKAKYPEKAQDPWVKRVSLTYKNKSKNKLNKWKSVEEFEQEEDWEISMPGEGNEDLVVKKKSSGKSPIDIFGQDEDWDIALPTIPEGKEDDECAKTKKDACDFLFAERGKPKDEAAKAKRNSLQGSKAKRDCSDKAKKEKKETKDKKEEPLRSNLKKERKETHEAGEEKGKDEKNEKDEGEKAKRDLGQAGPKTKKDEGVEAKRSLEGLKTKKDEGVEVKMSVGKTEGLKTKKDEGVEVKSHLGKTEG